MWDSGAFDQRTGQTSIASIYAGDMPTADDVYVRPGEIAHVARVTAVLIAVLAVVAAAAPVWQFARVLPEIAPLYGHALAPGWGVYVLMAGFGAVVVGAVALGWRASSRRSG